MAKQWHSGTRYCPDCDNALWFEMSEDGVQFIHRTSCNVGGECENCEGTGNVEPFDGDGSHFCGVACGTCMGLGKLQPCRSDAEIIAHFIDDLWTTADDDRAEHLRDEEISYRNG